MKARPSSRLSLPGSVVAGEARPTLQLPPALPEFGVGSGPLGEPPPEIGPGMVKEPRTQAGSKVVEQVIDDFEFGIDVQVDVDEVVVTYVDVCVRLHQRGREL